MEKGKIDGRQEEIPKGRPYKTSRPTGPNSVWRAILGAGFTFPKCSLSISCSECLSTM